MIYSFVIHIYYFYVMTENNLLNYTFSVLDSDFLFLYFLSYLGI